MKKRIGLILLVSFISISAAHNISYAIGFTDLQDLNLVTEGDLANRLMGARATITNVVFTGASISAGTFQNGLVDGIGIDQGIILTTGDVLNAVGPNNDPLLGIDNFQAGDASLDLIVGTPPGTFDSTILEFDFRTTARVVTFRFVFASDEYNEVTAPTTFGNDVFALYIDGVNAALTPGTHNPITVSNINLNSNSSLFINNDPNFFFPADPPFLTQYDGFTKVLRVTVAVTPNVTHHIRLAIADEFDGGVDSAVFLAPAVFAVPETAIDFDKDGMNDIAVYRSNSGGWFMIPSGGGPVIGVGFGGDPSDVPVPGDYNGDGITDIAVYRKDTGAWFITLSGAGTLGIGFGGDVSDIPVSGDYNGDGITDIAVYRKSTGGWFISPSGGGTVIGVGFGGDPSDIPVPGDYNGDGITDIAVYRKDTGAWFVNPSGGGAAIGVGFGGDPSDLPVPGDYDGDGITDFAVYRKSTGAWFVFPSKGGAGAIYGVGFGGDASDMPVPGDYDGDGITDMAIYRKSTGAWFVFPSSTGSAGIYGVGFGGDPSDIPLTSALPGLL